MLLDPVLNHLEDSVSLAVVGRRYEGATNKFINLLTNQQTISLILQVPIFDTPWRKRVITDIV